jgi:hypothetical protein
MQAPSGLRRACPLTPCGPSLSTSTWHASAALSSSCLRRSRTAQMAAGSAGLVAGMSCGESRKRTAPGQEPAPAQGILAFPAASGRNKARDYWVCTLAARQRARPLTAPRCLSRPLVLGQRVSNARIEYCIASEDCAFGPIGFERVRDLAPGEMVVRPRAAQPGASEPARLSHGGALCAPVYSLMPSQRGRPHKAAAF